MRRIMAKVAVRLLAVFVLVLGLVVGVYVGVTRDVRERATVSGESTVDEQREMRDMARASRERRERQEAIADAAAQARARAAAASRDAAARARAAAGTPSPGESTKPPDIGPIPASCNEYTGHRATGCALLLQWGFPIAEMPCLEKLWTRESGWNPRSQNRSSGAYGIPQALPGDKMAKYGSDWRTNAATQIKWGLDYIKNRYGTPCKAWAFFLDNGWY